MEYNGEQDINHLINLLASKALPLSNEKELQAAIELLLSESIPEFEREYRLDGRNIVDFFCNGTAIEVKIKGSASRIYKQLERYCEFDEVQDIILVTNKAMGLPDTINGKNCYYISLGTAWL